MQTQGWSSPWPSASGEEGAVCGLCCVLPVVSAALWFGQLGVGARLCVELAVGVWWRQGGLWVCVWGGV